MPKKLILVLAVAGFFFKFGLAFAGVVISEVKISPTEERFIKLYNTDSAPLDLTNWYIQRKTQTGTSFNSLVSKTNFENKKINANSSFLISRTSIEGSDVVVGDLTLTESNVIQLKNGNGEVVDKACWGDVSDCGDPKIPNPPAGQSIKFTDQSTPASVPSASSAMGSLVNTEVSTGSSSNNVTTKNKLAEEPKIKAEIIGKTFGFADNPISFQALAFGYAGEPLHFGKYFWNFGDGDSKEIEVADSKAFAHTYFYPGEYTVTLEYFGTNYAEIPDATTQTIVKIIGADIVISRVGDEKDFFVELANNTAYDIDISNWFLTSESKSFQIPRNTTLVIKKKIILSPKITNFSLVDRDSLKLINPQGETMFDYNPPVDLQNQTVKISKVAGTETKAAQGLTLRATEPPIESLLASAVSSNDGEDNIKNNSYTAIIIAFFAIFLGISAYAVYFIRSKKIAVGAGNDFEILDE